MAVVPSINPDYVAQPLTQYAIDRYMAQSAQETRTALAVTTAPIMPSIVEPPAQSLPSDIIKPLPTIVAPSAAFASEALESSGRCGSRSVEAPGSGWLCALGRWVKENPILALAVIGGTYAVSKGKGK